MQIGEMIQMLSTLSEIKNRKLERELEQRRLDQSSAQFDRQFGLQDRSFDLQLQSTHNEEVQKFIDRLINGTPETRQDMLRLSSSYGITADELTNLQSFASDAPQTVASIRDSAATAGRAAADPDVLANQNLEAGNIASTGMSTGQMMESQFTGQLALGAHEKLLGMTSDQADPYYIGALASASHPLEGAWEASVIGTPGAIATTAGIHFGLAPSWEQQAAMDLQKSAQQLQSQRALGPLTPAQRILAIDKISNMLRVASTKGMSPQGRVMIGGLINAMGQAIGFTTPLVTDPQNMDPAGVFQQLNQSITGWDFGQPQNYYQPSPSPEP